MAWIEVHQSLRDHRKILALADMLDLPEPHVAGHCLYLWLWALDNAADGVLPPSERIIARAAGWTHDPHIFVDALLSTGMIDKNKKGQYRIHDWDDYAGKLADRRERNRLSMRAAREREKATRVHHVDDTSTSRDATSKATVQYPTVPNSTQPYSSAVSVNGYQSSSSSKPATAGKTRAHARTTTTFLKNLDYAEQARWVADVPDDLQASWSVADRRTALQDMLTKCKEMHWTPHEKSYHEWLRNEKKHVPENASEVEKWTAILASFNKETGKCSNGQSWNFVNDELQDAKRRERDQRRSANGEANGEAKLVYLEPSYPEPSS